MGDLEGDLPVESSADILRSGCKVPLKYGLEDPALRAQEIRSRNRGAQARYRLRQRVRDRASRMKLSCQGVTVSTCPGPPYVYVVSVVHAGCNLAAAAGLCQLQPCLLLREVACLLSVTLCHLRPTLTRIAGVRCVWRPVFGSQRLLACPNPSSFAGYAVHQSYRGKV